MFTKKDYEALEDRIGKIITQPVEEIQVETELPPPLSDMKDSNKAYVQHVAILFIDIRSSTVITENSRPESLVKLYRSFFCMAVDCVRKNDGITRQFMGDRIMGVFTDELDANGDILTSSVDRAVNCARAMMTVNDFCLNKYLKNNVNGKTIQCGIGIDEGKVLITKVGMYGIENDVSKEDEVGCVWIGNATNRASRYADLTEGGEIFISTNVYNTISQELKKDGVWNREARVKKNKTFDGYVARNFYLEYASELGDPIKDGADFSVLSESSSQLAEMFDLLVMQQQRLIDKEKELAVLESKMKEEAESHKKQHAIDKKEIISLQSEIRRLRHEEQAVYRESYDCIEQVIKKTYCRKYSYMDAIGYEALNECIEALYVLGIALGRDREDITTSMDAYLIGIYDYFGKYDKSYDIMIHMAQNNNWWVNLEANTLEWAKEKHIMYKLIALLEQRIKECRENAEKKTRFEELLKKANQYF